MHKEISEKVNAYYTGKIKEHGVSPNGVDWNGEDSQFLRFSELMRVLPEDGSAFTVLDFGCGYGALIDALNVRFKDKFEYTGLDISEEMVQAARQEYGSQGTFLTELPEAFKSDFLIASGIFNVRLDTTMDEWEQYIRTTIARFDKLSLKGFSFNMLTSYSDADRMKDYLYYQVPEDMFRYCKLNFSRRVALLHDSPLYEFTILVRK